MTIVSTWPAGSCLAKPAGASSRIARHGRQQRVAVHKLSCRGPALTHAPADGRLGKPDWGSCRRADSRAANRLSGLLTGTSALGDA
jgi:hypothetical protein